MLTETAHQQYKGHKRLCCLCAVCVTRSSGSSERRNRKNTGTCVARRDVPRPSVVHVLRFQRRLCRGLCKPGRQRAISRGRQLGEGAWCTARSFERNPVQRAGHARWDRTLASHTAPAQNSRPAGSACRCSPQRLWHVRENKPHRHGSPTTQHPPHAGSP